MKIADINRFFENLGKRVDRPLKILLTGGAAGILQGLKRATFDIDFEIQLRGVRTGPRSRHNRWESVQQAIADAARATGIAAQYAEDIDTWSSIALPAKRSRLHGRFGKVEVRILDPELWSVGKLTRYLSTDIQDLRIVLKKSRVESKAAVKIWGTALGISPPSSSQAVFRRQVENFLDEYAREIWGDAEDPAELKRLFLEGARKARRRKQTR